MPNMFPVLAQPATTAQAVKPVNKLQAKEDKWGKYTDEVVGQIAQLEAQGWVVVYTDGSAKTVRGWERAGYGAYYAAKSSRNFVAPVPETEQSVSQGELRGVLHALLLRQGSVLVVLDSEYVFKGITEWSAKWRRHD